MSYYQRHKGLPFYGASDNFNFTTGRSSFTPGVSIKTVPLQDMSVKGDTGYSKLDIEVGNLRQQFKPGDRIRGIVVNSYLTKDTGKKMVGTLHKILPNYLTGEIRVWVRDTSTLKLTEVYMDTIERVYENVVLTYSQFISLNS
jgi:hypothetical protein